MDLNEETELLALLADGEFRSGEWLAGRLGISRAAIWKRVGKLAGRGIGLERVSGRGYRVPGGIELLERERIAAALPQRVRAQVSRLELRRVVDSTNALVLAGLRAGTLGHGAVVFAEQQTSGRGRRGRSWVSPFGRNIYCSFAWRFDAGVAALEGLSLVIGMGAVRALEQLGVPGVQLKWPNDLVAGAAKLGGVLIEIDGELAGPVTAVVGIGVNLGMPPDAGAAIGQSWTDLETVCGRRIGRNALAAALLESCFGILADFARQGFPHFAPEWERVDALRGLAVSVSAGAGVSLHGVADGIDAGGALRLRTPEGERLLSGGEISVRRDN
ncbi:MAG: bifunctional biotin--[acetyl-CoA-carboxylase] ligase/biotin operon repressor BirA [Pseudomonadales bacterium]|nr:bifunctional biotin--[acetyl-CoA-carboxylase] ligase/biotin operon repressor BirA [Pseudomonadales bacterium]